MVLKSKNIAWARTWVSSFATEPKRSADTVSPVISSATTMAWSWPFSEVRPVWFSSKCAGLLLASADDNCAFSVRPAAVGDFSSFRLCGKRCGMDLLSPE